MKHRLGHILAFAVCLQFFGGHWAVFQLVAWSKMLVTYSQQSGWQAGLRQTFDGQHPCCHCKAIEKGRASEKKEQPGSMEFKLTATPEILLSATVDVSPPSVQKADWPASDFHFSCRNHSPPTLPPLS